VEDLALHRSVYKDLTDEQWRWLLQQVEGHQRTADKLPTMHNAQCTMHGGWWYPPRISCEQCSSEATARYKAELFDAQCTMHNAQLIDLTGGAGVDTYFLSEKFDMVDYVEQNEELCRLAEHNLPEKVKVHNCTAEEWLEVKGERLEVKGERISIFIDPARRDKNGGKVFKLKDCTPNVVELLPKMQAIADTILIKLSPMLDITEALRELGGQWEVHVVAVKNEVKEVLLHSRLEVKGERLVAVDLTDGWKFEFTKEEETGAECRMLNAECRNYYLYEPGAAILKAGAYKLVGARYGLQKLGVNTHLYASERLVENFPGRVWKIIEVIGDRLKVKGEKANVLTRNYPLTAEQLKKKLKVKDGGDQYIIGTRIGEKPIVLLADRL